MGLPTTWLRPLLGLAFQWNGVPLTKRAALNFSGDVVIADNALTRSIDITAPKGKWVSVSTTPYFAPKKTPWIAVDLTAHAVSVSLWSAEDGDQVVIADVQGFASTHNLTVSDGGFDNQIALPQGGGFSSTQVYNTDGVIVRLKYLASIATWLPW